VDAEFDVEVFFFEVVDMLFGIRIENMNEFGSNHLFLIAESEI
jgi:hypothetical protein